MLLDLRAAIRSLRRAPGYAASAMLTLGLALGLVTTAFGLLGGALADRRAPGQALALFLTERVEGGLVQTRWPYPAIRLLRSQAASFTRIASYTTTSLNLSADGDPRRVEGELVSRDYFDILGLAPALGRLPIRLAADTPGEPAEVIISHRLWRSQFNGAASTVGRTIRLADVPLVVIGVLREGEAGLSGRADVWLPHTMAPRVSFAGYFESTEYFHSVIAEARPGVAREQAQAELDVIAQRIATALPPRSDEATDRGGLVLGLREARTDGAVVRSRSLVAGAAVLVLLVAGVNVAALATARATARRREFAVQLALGASRWRILRSVAAEIALLAGAGVGIALLLALWSRDAVVALMPPGLASPANDYGQLARFATLRLDWPVWIAVTLLGALATLTVSALAVRALLRLGLTTGLSRGVTEGLSGRFVLERAVVPIQIASSLALVAVAAMLLRTVAALTAIDPGFESRRVLSFAIAENQSVNRPGSGSDLARRVIDAVSAAPGVEAVTVAQCPPTGSRCARLAFIREEDASSARAHVVGWHRVGPNHFGTLGIRIIEGRGFTDDDRRGRPPVVVINQAAARRFFPDANPIGRRVRLPEVAPGDPAVAEIVGVVGDVLYWPADEPPGPDVYQPALQFSHAWMTVLARVAGEPMAAVAAIRTAMSTVDARLPLFDVAPLDTLARTGRADRRLVMLLLVAAAVLAVVLATVGVYGVTASWLEGRRREMAIRMALGAEPGGLVAMVMRSSLVEASIGAAGGVLLAAGAGQVVRSMLYGVSPHDPASLAGAVSLVLVVIAGAAYMPARRAGRVDPLRELKAE